MKNDIKIFLVDNDLFSLNRYSQGLENLGYENISLFLNGSVFFKSLHTKPDIIFIDYDILKLLGFDVLEKIKRHHSNVFINIFIAKENTEVAVNLVKYNTFDFIIKGNGEVEKMNSVIIRIQQIKEDIIKVTKPYSNEYFEQFN